MAETSSVSQYTLLRYIQIVNFFQGRSWCLWRMNIYPLVARRRFQLPMHIWHALPQRSGHFTFGARLAAIFKGVNWEFTVANARHLLYWLKRNHPAGRMSHAGLFPFAIYMYSDFELLWKAIVQPPNRSCLRWLQVDTTCSVQVQVRWLQRGGFSDLLIVISVESLCASYFHPTFFS